jgi:hypothetical protein
VPTFDAHKNFAIGAVLTPPSPATSGVTVVLGAGQGALMPAVPFNATVWPAGVNPTAANAEIVRVTARPGAADTFTILRTQEGSSARAILAGDQFAATITNKTLTDIESVTIPTPTAGGGWLHDSSGGVVFERPTLGDLAQSGASDKQVVRWDTASGAYVPRLLDETSMASSIKDGTSGTPSLRTLGTGAQQAAAGNDARLSDARTPTSHAATHLPAGSDPLPWGGTVFQAGTAAAMPAASATYAGLWYYQTDKRKLFQCASDGSAWQQRTSSRVLYDVTDYGAASSTGSSNDTTNANAFAAAHADAAAAGGGDIVIPEGYFRLGAPTGIYTNGSSAVIIASGNLAGRVRWRGMGRGLSTIRLTPTVSTFQFGGGSNAHPTYQNYAFEDFTIDGNGSATTNKGYLVHYVFTGGSGNLYDLGLHEFRRVDSVNFGRNNLRTFIRAEANRAALGETDCYFRHIYVTDCFAGRSGGGGDGGVVLFGFCNTNTGTKDSSGRFKPSSVWNLFNPAALTIDQVYIHDFHYDSGIIPSGTGGAGVQLGGDGWVRHARITGGSVTGSSDVGDEIDGGYDVEITGRAYRNIKNEAVLLLPFGNGTGTQGSHIRVLGCTATYDAADSNGTPITKLVTDQRVPPLHPIRRDQPRHRHLRRQHHHPRGWIREQHHPLRGRPMPLSNVPQQSHERKGPRRPQRRDGHDQPPQGNRSGAAHAADDRGLPRLIRQRRRHRPGDQQGRRHHRRLGAATEVRRRLHEP